MSERWEERRTNLQTYRKNEERQAEVAHETERIFVKSHSEMARNDTGKENPGSTERYAAHLDFAEQRADGYYNRQYKYRVRNALSENKLFDKFHSFKLQNSRGKYNKKPDTKD